MKVFTQIIISTFLIFLTVQLKAQCREHIQNQGNNNAFDVTLTFNDAYGNPLQTCGCKIAGSSGNLNCPDSCYVVPGSGYLTITFVDDVGNSCLYDSTGKLITPLPIELVSFTAKITGENIILVWETASETNNDYFTLERTRDLKEFETVAKINGSGNSSSFKSYSFIDKKPLDGISYYRLKQVDYDGKVTCSDYRIVNFVAATEFTFKVFPNPGLQEKIQLIIGRTKGNEVLLSLYDVVGKEVSSKTVIITDAIENSYPLCFSSENKLPAGIYIISASSEEFVKRSVLIIE